MLSSRGFRFSNTSYVLATFFIVLHTIGRHYTFERVPFDAVSQFFDFERNHYDRVAHFSVGLYAYPIAEVLMVKRLVHSRWIIALFPVFAIAAVAGAYEIIEWQYALNSDPAAGIAVLGSQGDIWDAQRTFFPIRWGAVGDGAVLYPAPDELRTLRAGRARVVS